MIRSLLDGKSIGRVVAPAGADALVRDFRIDRGEAKTIAVARETGATCATDDRAALQVHLMAEPAQETRDLHAVLRAAARFGSPGSPEPDGRLDAAPRASIAVGPFKDLSAGRHLQPVIDGFAEDLVTSLARTTLLGVVSQTITARGDAQDEIARCVVDEVDRLLFSGEIMATSGPKAIELAGEIADGVLLVGFNRGIVERGLEPLERGARRAGRRVEAVHKIYPDLSHAHDWEAAIAATSFVPNDARWPFSSTTSSFPPVTVWRPRGVWPACSTFHGRRRRASSAPSPSARA